MSVVVGATAQTTSLSFDDALLLGMERNPAIVASDYAEQAAHRERQAAIGLFMPQISIKGAYSHFNKDIKIVLVGYDTELNSKDDTLKPNTKIMLNIARILLKNTKIFITCFTR